MLTAQRKKLLSAVVLAFVAEALLFTSLPDWIRVGALLLWAVFIPGHLLVEIVGRDFGAPATRLEWGIYAMGAGLALLLVLMLLLSYVPGPLPSWYLHVGVDLVLLILLVAAWPIAGEEPHADLSRLQLPLPRWEIVTLLLILALAAVLRLTNLGYAEFHGDEARAILRAAAVVQGYDDVLFLHKKGPAEILIPTAIFAALGNITETTARLPFAIINLSRTSRYLLAGQKATWANRWVDRGVTFGSRRLLYRLCAHCAVSKHRHSYVRADAARPGSSVARGARCMARAAGGGDLSGGGLMGAL